MRIWLFLRKQEDISIKRERKLILARSDFSFGYHLFGTGYTDEARGQREIHWMLYPHFPLENHLNEEELKTITGNLLTGVETRKHQIEGYINRVEQKIKERGEPQIIG